MSVILLMTDTTRFDMLGCVNPDISTPNLDRLAAGGIRYDRAYTCQPVCGPARASIFTGLFPAASGCWGNSIPLSENVKTIGQRLRDNGIRAGYIGKWHLDASDYFGLGRPADGWDPDLWYDMRNYLEELTPEQRVASRDENTALTGDGIDADFTFGHRCANRAIDYLEKHAGEDFLLCVSFDEPHGPFLCPEPYASMYKDYEVPITPAYSDTLETKPQLQSYWRDAYKQQVPYKPRLYYGCQTFIDNEIGRVMEAIKKYAPDSLVIYTSDHGHAMSAHSLQTKGPAIYDEVARVPFIVNWPGRVKPGTIGGLASHIDICPTIMEYFNLKVPNMLQGRSMLPAFDRQTEAENDKVFVTFNRFEVIHDAAGGFQPMRAVITKKYKLAIYMTDPVDELYDIENDPYDMNNLINDPAYADVRAELHDMILKHMNDTRDPFRGYQWANRLWRSAYPPSWVNEGYARNLDNEEYNPRQLSYETGLPITEIVRKLF